MGTFQHHQYHNIQEWPDSRKIKMLDSLLPKIWVLEKNISDIRKDIMVANKNGDARLQLQENGRLRFSLGIRQRYFQKFMQHLVPAEFNEYVNQVLTDKNIKI